MSNGYSTPCVIAKKRDSQILSREEIDTLIQGVVKGEVQESQLGAFLMAVFIKGMSLPETVDLTRAMVHSGDTLQWPEEWKGLMVDKHSTGGVGDKISLPLAPALAACGLKVPMISGRGLGHTGGTLDKLEAIPGFQVGCTPDRMIKILDEVGCCIVSQTSSLVPADRIMYATRDVTGTVESMPLIASSIVSKKIAENLDCLVLDVKCGKAAFMKTEESARELAKWMVEICSGLGIKTTAVLTRMDDPLGMTIGNALEVVESLHCLHGNGPADIQELVFELGGHLLYKAGKADTPDQGGMKIRKVIRDGTALKKFCEMLQAQGVDASVANHLCDPVADVFSILRPSQYLTEVKSVSQGYVHGIDALELAVVSSELGAGRTKAGDPINHAVGVELCVHIGSYVTGGDVVYRVHHDHAQLSSNHVDRLQRALCVEAEKVRLEKMTRVLEVLTHV